MTKTIQDYCDELMWNATELSRQANLSWHAAKRAIDGQSVAFRTQRNICKALTEAVGQPIRIKDIQWTQEEH